MGAITRQQLCAELSISESTVRRLELAGLPCTPIGRHKRYDLDEVKGWLRSRECQTGQTKPDGGMLASWSKAAECIASSRKVHLRVMPSGRKPPSGKVSGDKAA